MDLHMKDRLAFGAYAVVFAIGGRVFKLFKKAAAGAAVSDDLAFATGDFFEKP